MQPIVLAGAIAARHKVQRAVCDVSMGVIATVRQAPRAEATMTVSASQRAASLKVEKGLPTVGPGALQRE
jgi:hypothetical protein